MSAYQGEHRYPPRWIVIVLRVAAPLALALLVVLVVFG